MIKSIRKNLSLKVFLFTFVLLMGASLLTYLFISWAMPITYKASQSAMLNADVEELAYQLKDMSKEEGAEILAKFSLKHGVDVILNDEYGSSLSPAKDSNTSSRNSYTLVSEDMEAVDVAEAEDVNTAVGYSFTFKDDEVMYTLLIKGSMRAVNQAVEALKKIWPWLVLAVFVISVLSSLFYSRYLTKPIIKMSAIAQKMSDLEFDWRCDEERKDEIGSLAVSLNELSEKLSFALTSLKQANQSLQNDIDQERALEEQRLEFFTAVSHELKTPLTVLKGQLEGMSDKVGVYEDRDKYLRHSLKVVERMEDLVSQIVMISRMENADFDLHKECFDLGELCHECITQCQEFALSRQQHWQIDIEDSLMLIGNYSLMKKAIDNILCNAIAYSPQYANITVHVYKHADGMFFECINSDTKIPETSLPHLFETFYRVEQSRSRSSGGSGLGLYLVKLILNAHHAAAAIQNIDEGVCFTISFQANYYKM